MEARKTKIITEEIEVVTDVFCNKCAQTCKVEFGTGVDRKEKLYDFYGLIDATVSGGYFSKSLNDMTRYTFSLCEACLFDLFKTFVIPVEEKDMFFNGFEPKERKYRPLDDE